MIKPTSVIKVKNLDEIINIVNLARQKRTPLVPVSSGPPHLHDGAIPSLGGSVVVDLREMNQIVRIDRYNRVAMVEPGVTFQQLIPEVEKQGLRLNMPLLPRSAKSVVGSMLEREPVMMPVYHWDIADPLCCVEVVFGTGEVFRTGAAAGPGSVAAQWSAGGAQKEAAGPHQSSWYRVIQGAQGTMGIVSWASLRCELLPQAEEPFLVGSHQLEPLLEMVHWLVRLNLVNECFILNRVNLAIITSEDPLDYSSLHSDLPEWTLFFVIAGYEYFPQERIDYQSKDMLSTAAKNGLEPVKRLGKVEANKLMEIIHHPSSEPYWKLRHKGACGDVSFLALYDDIEEMKSTFVSLAEKYGYPFSCIGIYLQPIVQGVNCHCEFDLFYNPLNPEEVRRLKELSREAIGVLTAKGAFFSRPYGENSEIIVNRDGATAAALKKVKSIVDPDNILNPGKLYF